MDLQVPYNPVKIIAEFFAKIDKLILNFIWKLKRPNSQHNPGEEEGWGAHTTRFIRSYYVSIVIKTMWYWHKDRQTDQWVRTWPGKRP